MSFDTWFNNQYDRRASSSVGYAHDGPLVLGFDQHGAGRCGYPAYRDFSDGYSAMPYADDRSYGWAARGTGWAAELAGSRGGECTPPVARR